MGLRPDGPLAYSININIGGGGLEATFHHAQNPRRARGTSTPALGVPSLYVWTPWRRCCCCCCADRLRRREVVAGMRTRRSVRGTRSTTFSTPMRKYVGSNLFQLIFRCAARLVVMIYDLLLASMLGVRNSL
jgi:hypothetical protein